MSVRTVERDPAGGWIARNPYTGREILEEGFRWNCRESARTAVWDARHLSPEAKAAKSCRSPVTPTILPASTAEK